MSKRSALYIVPAEDGELLLLYADQKNYQKFKAGDDKALFIARKHDGSFIIEFEDGKPVFNEIVP